MVRVLLPGDMSDEGPRELSDLCDDLCRRSWLDIHSPRKRYVEQIAPTSTG